MRDLKGEGEALRLTAHKLTAELDAAKKEVGALKVSLDIAKHGHTQMNERINTLERDLVETRLSNDVLKHKNRELERFILRPQIEIEAGPLFNARRYPTYWEHEAAQLETRNNILTARLVDLEDARRKEMAAYDQEVRNAAGLKKRVADLENLLGQHRAFLACRDSELANCNAKLKATKVALENMWKES